MNAMEAYSDLLRMGKPALTTEDAALRLGLSVPAAIMTLRRLEHAGLVQRIFRGLWTLDPKIDPLAIPEHLTAPFPAYVSFQSALYLHGMISQIPQVIYVASLGPTRRVKTSKATYSIHRLAPEFFGGYTTAEDSRIRLATPEKALLDVIYLTSARSRLFAHLPEVALPRGFSKEECRRWIEGIRDPSRKTMVRERLSQILGVRKEGSSSPRSPKRRQ